MDRTDRPSDSQPNGEDISARLAHIVANSDMDELKQLLLEKLGITSREELIDKALSILDSTEEESDATTAEKITKQTTRRPLNTNLRSLIDDDPPSRVEANAQDDIGLDELLEDNQGLLLQLLYERFINRFVRDDPRVNLLYALKPFLNERRQQRIEAAVKMMGLQSAVQAQMTQTKGV